MPLSSQVDRALCGQPHLVAVVTLGYVVYIGKGALQLRASCVIHGVLLTSVPTYSWYFSYVCIVTPSSQNKV